MSADTPVLDTLAAMTAASLITAPPSPPRDFVPRGRPCPSRLARPQVSGFANASAITESGLTAEDVQGIMIAVAPVVGAPRVMSAGGHILRALGFAIAVAEAELAAEESQP